jgi:hypothetical protein
MRKLNKTNPEYLAQRAARGDIGKALRILKRAGAGRPPLLGDELPPDRPSSSTKARTATVNPDDSIDQQLRFAIAHKRLIQLTYGGYLRVLEPHDYGVQKGTPRLLAYQIRGGSSHAKGGKYGWKLLKIPKIEACAVLEESFPGSRARSTQEHLVWDQIFARVE